jgi:hypothetical protein
VHYRYCRITQVELGSQSASSAAGFFDRIDDRVVHARQTCAATVHHPPYNWTSTGPRARSGAQVVVDGRALFLCYSVSSAAARAPGYRPRPSRRLSHSRPHRSP